MHNKKIPALSLRAKMGLVILFGIVLGLLVALLTNFIAHNVADDLFFSAEKMQENMKDRQVSFQSYVAENDLSSVDSVGINKWAEENDGISLFIYKENKLILQTGETVTTTLPTTTEPTTEYYDPYAPPYPGYESRYDPNRDRYDPNRPRREDAYYYEETEITTQETTEESTEPTTVVYEVFTGNEEDIVYAQETTRSALENLLLTKDSGYVEVQFSDGKAIVCFIDNSEKQADSVITLVSVFTSFLTFAILILIYYTKKVNDVIDLAQTVRRVGEGELDLNVSASGRDEIALLADEVDAMRCSVAEKIENEKQAAAAANELVTTMSHDIRTPLTALIGYLDILEESADDSDDKMKQYLQACGSKAQQLKHLSDRLFNYFLVYGHTMVQQSPENIDAQIFLTQVLGEQAQYLLGCGLSVQYTPYDGDGFFFFDANEVCRVFDNVFSNIVRYGDRNAPVFICAEKKQEQLYVYISNRVDNTAVHSESSGLGLKICSRVMQQCGGTFEAKEEDGEFKVCLVLPLFSEEENHKKNK